MCVVGDDGPDGSALSVMNAICVPECAFCVVVLVEGHPEPVFCLVLVAYGSFVTNFRVQSMKSVDIQSIT